MNSKSIDRNANMKKKTASYGHTWISHKRLDTTNTYHSLKVHFDDNIELIKIALKKQKQRKIKLEKLEQKYMEVQEREKRHSKQIKASIIELKDFPNCSKLKIFASPAIFINNQLKIETREFLTRLLNTFYNTYSQYKATSQKINEINEFIAYIVKSLSYMEQMLIVSEKGKIIGEIKLEGELLSEKNQLKEIDARRKRIEDEFVAVKEVYFASKSEYDQKRSHIGELIDELNVLKGEISELDKNITDQENLRKNCRDKISQQLTYQNLFKNQLSHIMEQISEEKKKQKALNKQIFNIKTKRKAERMNLPLCENIKHEVRMEIKQAKVKK